MNETGSLPTGTGKKCDERHSHYGGSSREDMQGAGLCAAQGVLVLLPLAVITFYDRVHALLFLFFLCLCFEFNMCILN